MNDPSRAISKVSVRSRSELVAKIAGEQYQPRTRPTQINGSLLVVLDIDL